MIVRTHFARFLVKQGVVMDIKSAFKRFLGGGQPCYVPQQWASLAALPPGCTPVRRHREVAQC